MASTSIIRSARQYSSLAKSSVLNKSKVLMSLSASPSHPSCFLPHRFSSTTSENQAEATTSNPVPSSRLNSENSSNDKTSNDNSNAQALADQLAQKDAQLAEYKDLYIRARADYENLQKITAREKVQAKDYAIQSFAKDLVSNIDVLQLALNSVPEKLRTVQEQSSTTPSSSESSEGSSLESEKNQEKKHLADLWGGVQSTKSLLEKTLSRYGVTPFDPTGEQFDPNKHEAMYQALVPGKTPNSVLNCSKLGWMLRDRVLRPAQVGVAQGSES